MALVFCNRRFAGPCGSCCAGSCIFLFFFENSADAGSLVVTSLARAATANL
jgi:hypothetical protein